MIVVGVLVCRLQYTTAAAKKECKKRSLNLGPCKKNNTKDSNVVPHRSTNLARSCLTSLSRREAVWSWLYGRSYQTRGTIRIYKVCLHVLLIAIIISAATEEHKVTNHRSQNHNTKKKKKKTPITPLHISINSKINCSSNPLSNCTNGYNTTVLTTVEAPRR